MSTYIRRLFTPRAGIILVSLFAPFALTFLVFNLERHYADARFHELAEQRIISIQSNLDIAESSVTLIANHFAISDIHAANRNGFLQLVSRTLKDHTFVQAYSFNPLVSEEDLREHELKTRINGHSDYVVTERDQTGKSVPVLPRQNYVPIQYIEPYASNKAAVGFDLASNPVRQVALIKARETRTPQVTGRIKLVQESGNQYGVLLLAPVFDATGQSGDIGKGALKGYVSGVFRMGDLVNSTDISGQSLTAPAIRTDASRFNRISQSLVEIHLIDASAPESEQFLYPVIDETSAQRRLDGARITKAFSFGGREWKIVAVPSEAFLVSTIPLASIATLLTTLLASGLLLLYLEIRTQQTEEATEHARSMTRAKERLSEAQRIARLATIEFDRDQEMVDLGEGAEEMLGLAPGIATTLREFLVNVDPHDRLDFVDLLFCETDMPQKIELNVNCGETGRTLEAVVSRAGEGSHVLVTLQDITHRKIEERERNEMVERVSEADRLSALGTMAGGIAHEINTPVQYIGDNLRFINDQVGELLKIAEIVRQPNQDDCSRTATELDNFDLEFAREETPSALKQALDGIDQIARIVQAVKEYSHPTSQKFAATDLNHAVETVVTITRNQWKYVTELHLDLDPTLPHISAVEGEINQVLVNLVVNASHAIAEKGGNSLGHIWISTRRIDNEVSIAVRDDGPGIPPENLKKIFDMFFTTKPPGKGTGQGLALVKSIVHRHGGMISVESELGQGALFVVRLPIEQIEHKGLYFADMEE